MIYLLAALIAIPFLGMLYFMKKVKDGEEFNRRAEENLLKPKIDMSKEFAISKQIIAKSKLAKLISNREIPDSELNAEWDLDSQILETLDNMKKAYGILRLHNNWRQGAEIEPVDPKDLTVALEVALKAMDDTIGLCEEEWGGEWEMK